ncbi:MAG: cysteine--tRNA ligase [Candidatus Omnitrophica bacterium]|nr:cysteine--tRNA ligase [Candidatus Omnitrophota bacterium]
MPETIRFFNTLSGQLENFIPLCPGEVGIYTCGPTVYDYAHIGNFRAFVFEDLLRRFLEFAGYTTRHVMNITDVDDKTISGAPREGKTLNEFTEFYTRAFLEDLRKLNILPATVVPRATDEIYGENGMIGLIQTLIRKGIAYESEGSVYYRIAAFPYYGMLSKKRLKENIQGARVDVDEYEKEEGADFVLWKKAKEGEPSWDSPWGKGRPGWHIECSAMSLKYLGKTFDIHAGGEDLIFPHHENEIAQSEAATGVRPFVRFWLHCKHLLVNGEKMSKSKGNFFTLRDLLLKGYDPMALRYALLSVHYRTPLNFTLEGLKEASGILKKLDDCYYKCLSLEEISKAEQISLGTANRHACLWETLSRMTTALADDLNISVALASMLEGVKMINSWLADYSISGDDLSAALDYFREVDRLLGLDVAADSKIPTEVTQIWFERVFFRGRQDFRTNKGLQKESDNLRAKLYHLGWLVHDGRPGEPSTLKKRRRVWDTV